MIGTAQIAAFLARGGWRYAAGAGAVIAVLASYAWAASYGYRAAQAKCEAAAIRAERDALKRDLDNALESARDANRRADALQQKHQKSEEVLRDYEQRLAQQPKRACALSGDDVRRLRQLRGR